jgi:hypothetical protein
MDQNVIRLKKLHYRTALLSTIITNNVKDVREFIKKLNLKDAVMNLISGWDQIKEDTIAKCWNKILDFSESYEDAEDDIPLHILQRKLKSQSLDVDNVVQETIVMLNNIVPDVSYIKYFFGYLFNLKVLCIFCSCRCSILLLKF